MASYNVNSTKSYMHAMEPMIEAVSKMEIGTDAEIFKLPRNIIDDRKGEQKIDLLTKDMRWLLKSFENVDRELLIDYEGEEEDGDKPDNKQHLGKEEDVKREGIISDILEGCKRVYKKQFSDDTDGSEVES